MADLYRRQITPGDSTRYTTVYGILTNHEDPAVAQGQQKIFFAFGQGDLPMIAFTFSRSEVSLDYFSEKFAGLRNRVTIRMGWLVLLYVMGSPFPQPKALGAGFEHWYSGLEAHWMSTLPVLPLPGE
jgi:hypothetical protein